MRGRPLVPPVRGDAPFPESLQAGRHPPAAVPVPPAIGRVTIRAEWLWAFLAVCAATIPFLTGLTGSRVFYVRDLSKFFWGRYLWLRHELLSGSFPLWDPYVGAGQSAVGDALHQLFLLPALAVRLIGSDVLGFNLWVAAPFPLGALGAWLFFRRRFAPDASAIGSIAFALSGPIVSTGNFPNLSWSAAAIPWMLWAVDRVSSVPGPRPVAVLAMVTALQAVAGEPVTLLATLVLGLAYAVLVQPSVVARPARQVRVTACVALGLGLGLCLAAIQLMPLARAAALSERSTAIARDFWSLHPLALVEMVSLHLFGDYFTIQSLSEAPWLPLLNSGREPLLFSIYFGVPLLVTAMYGLISGGPTRWGVFWACAGAASLVSAFGAYTPVYPFLRDHLPLLPSLRFPAKYLVIWSMVVAAGAAAGWDAMGRPAARGRFTPARSVAVGLSLTIGGMGWIVAGACLYLPAGSGLRLLESARSLDAADPAKAAAYMLRALPHAASTLLLLSVVTAGLMALAARKHTHGSLARKAMFGLIVFDLLVNAWRINPTFDPAYLSEPAWLAATHAHPDARFYVGGKTEGTLNASDFDSSGPYLNPPGLSGSASRAALSGQADFHPSGWRSREMLSYDLAVLWPREFDTMTRQFFLSGRFERDLLLDRAGVRYRILPEGQAGGRTPVMRIPYFTKSFLYDYGSAAAPRVMTVAGHEVVRDVGQQIERLFTAGWDVGSTAIVGHEPAAAGDAGPPLPPSATITADQPNRVVVEATAPESGGYLVLLDSFSDGWRATADGRPAIIVRANGLFRAVRLTPGSHVVEFLYRPRAFVIGAAGSAAALAVVVGLLAWPTIHRRRQGILSRLRAASWAGSRGGTPNASPAAVRRGHDAAPGGTGRDRALNREARSC